MSAKKGWDGGSKDRCWSCDAPNPVEHNCDYNNTVWACEEECPITVKTRHGAGVIDVTWDDCPECQHWQGVEEEKWARYAICDHPAPCRRCVR